MVLEKDLASIFYPQYSSPMQSAPVEIIDSALSGLVAMFLENSRADLQAMRQALAKKDFQDLARLGHSMKGAGLGFGFQRLAAIGERVETAARLCREEEIEAALQSCAQYLDQVVVKFK